MIHGRVVMDNCAQFPIRNMLTPPVHQPIGEHGITLQKNKLIHIKAEKDENNNIYIYNCTEFISNI